MSVAAKTVQGRRELRFRALAEAVADAEKLVSSATTKPLGNWPVSRLLTHLAMAMNGSIDGISFKAPWYARLFGYFVKGRAIKRGMRAGIRLPREVETGAFPAAASPQDALDIFRKAVARMQSEKASAAHPIFGRLTHEEWIQFHLRHAELHLSFAVPS